MANDALDKLLLVSVLMAEDMQRDLKTRGLSRARANAIWEIARHGPVTQRQIADLLRVTPRNVTALIDALEETGFVARKSHASDRRAVIVALTEKGEAAVAALKAEAETLAAALFAGLPEADVATLIHVLDTVADRIVALQHAQN